jgi:SPP1 family predicted phage head-tail adaptor
MFAGKLDRRITLERATKAQDEYGEEVLTWGTLATVWASFKPVSDGERMAAREVSAELTARFQIRWDSAWSDLSAQDRLIFDGKTYSISGVKEIGRREGIEITAAVRND